MLIYYSFHFSTFAQLESDRNLLKIDIDSNVVLPPSWAFGVLYGGYTNQVETIERINNIIAHDYPIDAYWIDSWFWSYLEKGKDQKII